MSGLFMQGGNKMKQESAIKVGAGKAAVIYPEGFFPYSGFRGRYLIGIHDDINARAIAVKNSTDTLLFLSIELGDVTDEWLPEIQHQTGVPIGNIFLTCTHTHEAPYAGSGWGERVEDEAKTAPFCAACLAAILTAAKYAMDHLRPASITVTEGSCGVNVSRVHKYEGDSDEVTSPYISVANEHEYSDHTVSVARFTDENGAIIALLVNYPVHSSVLFRQSWDHTHGNLVSGDLAGAAMRYVEERIPGAVSLMTLGAAGDQIPRAVMVHPVVDGKGNLSFADYGDQGGYALTDAMGTELGEEVLFAAAQPGETIQTCMIRTAAVDTPVELKEPWEGGPPTKLPVGYEYEPCGSMELHLQLVALGDMAYLTIPSELVASVGTELKNILKQSGFSNAAVITQCNGAWQYISDLSGYERKTFEAIESHFMPTVVEKLKESARTLCRNV
jgi:hypothetical protein